MKLHWGPTTHPAKVAFEYSTVYFNGKQQTSIRNNPIAALYGLSFGESVFIGSIRFAQSESDIVTSAIPAEAGRSALSREGVKP